MHFLLTKYCIWPRRILFLPKVFQKVRKLRQILISRQNSVYKGLSFSSKSKLFGEGPLCLRTTFATLVSTIPDGSSLMTRGEWTLRLRHIHRWKLMYTWYTWRLCLSHIEVDLDQVNPQEVLAEVPAQHLLWLLAKQLRLPTAGVQARLTLVNIFFFPCSSLWLSLSLFITLSQIVQATVSAVSTDAQIGVLRAPSKVGSKNCSPIFCFFAKAQRRRIQAIFSAAPEAASAQVVAVEEASEPKGYNYPVPGTHTYFIQKLDRKIL